MRFDPTLPLLLFLAAFTTLGPPAVEAQDFRSSRTGLVVALPEGWEGSAAVDEEGLPSRALYTFTAEASGPYAGAVLRVEQVHGLDPLARQRWMRGHGPALPSGLRPVAALDPSATPFSSAIGMATEGPGVRGALYLLARGPALYAVSAEAPAGSRLDLRALAAGVRFGE